MRNLFLFLVKNYYFFLFLFLEAIAVILLVQNNKYQHAGFINSSNAITGTVYQTWSGVTDYLSLRQANELLAEENALLRGQAKDARTDYTVKQVSISDSVYKQKYSFITAKVVNNSTNRRNNYLTLNRGTEQGVSRGMSVICGEGVVGIVKEVSNNFCTVMSILHKDVNVPSSIRKFGENTIVQWDGSDYRIGNMDNVPSHLKVVKGDTIVTSAYSSVFPEGIMVGTIETIIPIQGNTFNNIKVHFSTDFRKLSYVYIVNNLLRDEQEKLEKETLSKEKAQ
jgi:rod shape-determining protein MreC